MAASTTSSTTNAKKKKHRKNIFISYSPDAGFMERKFISDTVRELKANNLTEDIWFDCDEHNTDNPCWFSLRMEAAEKCKAAILFISDSYLNCPVSIYEAKIFLHRHLHDPNSVHLFQVFFNMSAQKDTPDFFKKLKIMEVVDLTDENSSRLSLAEQTSSVIASFMNLLEPHATSNVPPPMNGPAESEFTGRYKSKKISRWSTTDLQEWLFKLGIKEFYRQSIAEQMVDGFLVMTLTDYDMVQHMSIDSRVVRRKIMHSIIEILDAEHKLKDSWHLRARTIKPKPGAIYIIYDPADVRLAQGLKQDLVKKGSQVHHHHKLGQSKEEFLEENSTHMATSGTALVLLTDAAIASPFVFHEIMFCDWLGKKIIVALFRNVWIKLRSSLKAVLGECPAVDFESQMYEDSLNVLEHHLKPQRSLPGVILEQAYINKMNDSMQPLSHLCNPNGLLARLGSTPEAAKQPTIYISYQWDVQSRVEDIQQILQYNNIWCWKDPTSKVSTTSNSVTSNSKQASGSMATQPYTRGNSSLSIRSSHTSTTDSKKDSLQNLVRQNMKAAVAVLACITPKYIQSEHCVKDLLLAESVFNKPIIPVMLQYCPWPPEGTSNQLRRLLARFKPIDLSNEKLYRQNVRLVIERVKKIVLPMELKH